MSGHIRIVAVLAVLTGVTACSENNTEADASSASALCTSVFPKLLECGEFATQSECCAEVAIEMQSPRREGAKRMNYANRITQLSRLPFPNRIRFHCHRIIAPFL